MNTALSIFRRPQALRAQALQARALLAASWLCYCLLASTAVAEPLEVPSSTGSAGTQVPIPNALTELLQSGGVPTSLDQMRLMEQQQQQVAKGAALCTVSVQIGAAQGCGVIITDTGYILTAAHVAMRPNKSAVIKLSDGRTVMATTLGMNREVDAGLIKINDGQNGGQAWPFASLGSSDDLIPGMWCIAMGHPGGYDSNRGPVTRVGRILAVRSDAIVTDCALIGGDSGGPLFDIQGRLIAVHSRIGNDVADNLHIPVNHYDVSWKRLAAGEAWGFLEGFRPILGVSGDGNDSLARIRKVAIGSAADTAGIRENDVVERFGDAKITDFRSLTAAVADTMPGERVEIWLRRGEKSVRLMVEVGRAD